jgi:hypothetical protein
MDDIEVKKNDEVALALNKLSSLLERAITTFEDTRNKAKENHEYFKEQMEECHRQLGTVSEDGVLEKATNDSLRHLIDSSKVLEQPIMAITRILTAKMALDAAKESSNKIVGPIDISAFK